MTYSKLLKTYFDTAQAARDGHMEVLQCQSPSKRSRRPCGQPAVGGSSFCAEHRPSGEAAASAGSSTRAVPVVALCPPGAQAIVSDATNAVAAILGSRGGAPEGAVATSIHQADAASGGRLTAGLVRGMAAHGVKESAAGKAKGRRGRQEPKGRRPVIELSLIIYTPLI